MQNKKVSQTKADCEVERTQTRARVQKLQRNQGDVNHGSVSGDFAGTKDAGPEVERTQSRVCAQNLRYEE